MGNAYVSGSLIAQPDDLNPNSSVDAFLTKFDSDGNFQWSRQLGSYIFNPLNVQTDISLSVAAADDLGNVFIAGRTEGDLDGTSNGSADGFLAKYDSDDNFQWARQFGTSFFDRSNDVAVDGLGNAYVAGFDGGTALGGGTGNQATLRKFDTDGNLVWLRTLDSSGSDSNNGVALDALGNVYVTGSARGEVGGSNADGGGFVSKYDVTGNLLWTKQFGIAASAGAEGICLDGEGAIYVTGATSESFFGQSAVRVDGFLVKLVEQVPEPASWSLLVCGTMLLMGGAASRRRERIHT